MIAGFNGNLAKWAAGENVGVDTVASERCTKMNVRFAKHAKTSAVFGGQGRLVDVKFDGTEIGGALLGFVLGPRPVWTFVPLRLTKFFVAPRAGSAVRAGNIFQRKDPPFRPAPPFQLIAGRAQQKTDARLARVHRWTGINVIAGNGAIPFPVHQPRSGAGKTIKRFVDGYSQAGGFRLEVHLLKTARFCVGKNGVGRRVGAVQIAKVIARQVKRWKRLHCAAMTRIAGIEIAFGAVKNRAEVLALDNDLMPVLGPLRRAFERLWQWHRLRFAELNAGFMDERTLLAGDAEKHFFAGDCSSRNWNLQFAFGRRGQMESTLAGFLPDLPLKIEFAEIREGVTVFHGDSNGFLAGCKRDVAPVNPDGTENVASQPPFGLGTSPGINQSPEAVMPRVTGGLAVGKIKGVVM